MDEEVRASLAETTETYRRRLGDLTRMRRELDEVTATASSRDRHVRVEVGPKGRLRDIRLGPQVYQRLSAGRLAATILELVDEAAREVAEREREIVAEYLPERIAERVRGGERDLSAYFPEGPSLKAFSDEPDEPVGER